MKDHFTLLYIIQCTAKPPNTNPLSANEYSPVYNQCENMIGAKPP